jgi:putative cell wall-binding protein
MINKRKIINGIVALSILGIIAFGFNNRVDADAVKIGLGGSTRYEMAIETSKNGWPSGSNAIVLASGADYPNALSAAPLAKKYDAPILLTENNSLPVAVSKEISRLKPSKAYIVGGDTVVSKDVESQLTSSPIILMEESGTYYPKVLERIKGIKSDQVLALGETGVVSESIVDKILEAVNYEEKFKVLSIE